jgi:transcription elongation GreA/GreB family factor
MESRPNQYRPTPDQVKQPEHAQPRRETVQLKKGDNGEIYRYHNRRDRLKRLSHWQRDERKLSVRLRRQEVFEEAQQVADFSVS